MDGTTWRIYGTGETEYSDCFFFFFFQKTPALHNKNGLQACITISNYKFPKVLKSNKVEWAGYSTALIIRIGRARNRKVLLLK